MVRFSGFVLPAYNGKVVQIQRKTRTGFKTVAQTTLGAATPLGTVARSKFSKGLRIRKNGTYRVLFNPAFPRSVYLCVREAADALADLKSRYRLRGGNDISEGLDQLRTILESRSIDEILAGGLHEFLDFLQGYLIVITDRLSAAFFGHKPTGESRQAADAAWPLAPLPQIPS